MKSPGEGKKLWAPFLSLALSLSVFAIGVVLRYRFICVDNRLTDAGNIFGDATFYLFEAEHVFDPAFVPAMFDTLYPPGAPIYFAVMRWFDPSLQLLVVSQWIMASLLPLILGYTAQRLFGRKTGLSVLVSSSLYFPLWEYFGYLISEGPFLFSMYLAFLLLILSLQSLSTRGALLWGVFGGLLLGASAACKSVALFSALLVFAALIIGGRRSKFRIWPTFASAALGVVIVLTPVSIRATRMNEGRFLLIANDASRTFLLGHQGRAGLTWWYDGMRNFHMNFLNPSTVQHSYTEEKTYQFGPYDNASNYAAGWQWIKENPGDTIFLSFEHVFDMFAIALPWPGYFRSYARWTLFFNELFIVLILIPASVHLARSARRMWRADPRAVGDSMVAAAAISIYIIAFFFVGEGRYRICYDGFAMMLAARAFFAGRNPVSPFDIKGRMK